MTTKSKETEKITKIIDKVLNQIFGKKATAIIYDYVETNYSIKRTEIGEKLDVFMNALEEFLNSGAYVVERKIINDLLSTYGSISKLKGRLELHSFADETKIIMQKA